MPREKQPEELAEEILELADQDESVDDLTRGTEVYEELDDEADDYEDDPQELNFDPKDGHLSSDSFEGDLVQDAYIDEDDY